ncbi:MAG: hypothetical protein K6F05_04765 [Succinivibrio sp.]|nr:hypothetical protein [Succinivibrio sp.]
MWFKSFFKYVGLVGLALSLSAPVYAAEPMRICMKLGQESFLLWYAKEKGWDQELGLNYELDVVEDTDEELLSKGAQDHKLWDVTATDLLSTVLFSKKMPLTAFALFNSKSRGTEIFVRKDSEILKTQGWNSAYPNVYGSPESLKANTFLVKENTPTFLILMCWSQVFGLDFKDIKYKSVEPHEAIEAMNEDSADGLLLLSPNTYAAELRGYVHAANAEDLNIFMPTLFVAHTEYAKQHAKELGKLIMVYEKYVANFVKHQRDIFAAYHQFLNEHSELEFTEEFCSRDLLRQRIFNLKEQFDFFTPTKDTCRVNEIRKDVLGVLNSIAAELKFSEQFADSNYQPVFTDAYIKEARDIERSLQSPKADK